MKNIKSSGFGKRTKMVLAATLLFSLLFTIIAQSIVSHRIEELENSQGSLDANGNSIVDVTNSLSPVLLTYTVTGASTTTATLQTFNFPAGVYVCGPDCFMTESKYCSECWINPREQSVLIWAKKNPGAPSNCVCTFKCMANPRGDKCSIYDYI